MHSAQGRWQAAQGSHVLDFLSTFKPLSRLPAASGSLGTHSDLVLQSQHSPHKGTNPAYSHLGPSGHEHLSSL